MKRYIQFFLISGLATFFFLNIFSKSTSSWETDLDVLKTVSIANAEFDPCPGGSYIWRCAWTGYVCAMVQGCTTTCYICE